MNVRLDINSNPSTANVDISEKIVTETKTRYNGGLKRTETHQCDNAGHWKFTKFENGETVWERHCGTGSDVLTIINMDREISVRAQHGKSRRISTGTEQPATTTVQTTEVTHTHTYTPYSYNEIIINTRLV